MTMQCRELREIADSYLAEELLVETNHEVLRHLEECPACRAEVIARRQLRATLKRAFATAETLQPDPALVSRLSRQLRARAGGTPEASRRRISAWWAIAAGLVLATVAGRALWRSATSERPAVADTDAVARDGAVRRVSRDAAGDHRDCALHFQLAEAPISLEDGARLYDASYRSLDEAVRAARDKQGQPFDFVEAHVCVFEGRRFAHVVLRQQGRLVSILVAERAAADAVGPAAGRGGRTPSPAPAVIGLPQVEGFRAAAFAAPRHWVFVVSELGDVDNLAVARAVADPVYRHLAGA